jgi:flavin-dependent dehydrogenase
VVIVGARCSGATLAILLARAGARVLLLDKDAMPSEHVLSTHSINPAGMDVLDEVGVGEAVRSVTPRSHRFRLSMDGESIGLELPLDRATFCPRRKRLDDLLQRAAAAAGAQLLDRTRVTSLVRTQNRVSGVRAVIGDREWTFSAGLVVGADGRHSAVARCVGAEEYLGYDAPRATYWGYWNAPDLWTSDPAYGFDGYFGFDGDDIRALFQTDGGQLLLGFSPPVERTRGLRADPRGALRAALEADPILAPLIRGSEPDGKIRGTVRERFFFRQAAGEGWALVGDAGHHKEYLLGDGITEALLQARRLAAAIGEGTDEARARWWRTRDVECLPLYFLGQLSGASPRPADLQRIVFRHVARDRELVARAVAVADRQLAPFEIVPVHRMLAWIAQSGRWRVVEQALSIARQAWSMDRELRMRRRLLAEAVALAPSVETEAAVERIAA